MAASLPRTFTSAHPRLTATPEAKRIAAKLSELTVRRARIDQDELDLINAARALGWAWEDVAAAYGPSPQTGGKWSQEGVRRRWIILDARRHGAEPEGEPHARDHQA
ncbi:MAG TPA: hypothetical protein VFU74_21680 [Actinocrinis sp.]|nr:hypothetical protein [Actinocrinis sp.]